MNLPTHQQLGDHLRGAVAMAVTPFFSDGSVDTGRMAELSRSAALSGIQSLVVAGGVGELGCLNSEDILMLVGAAVEGGRGLGLSVIAGLRAEPASHDIAQRAEVAGAAGVMTFHVEGQPRDSTLIETVNALIQGTGLGILIDTNGKDYSPEALRAATSHPHVLAVKYSNPDLRGWNALRACVNLAESPLLWLCGGADDVAPGFAAQGADGFTSTTSNISPPVVAHLQHLIRSGRHQDAAAFVAATLQPLASIRSSRPAYVAATTKAAMAAAGIPAGPVRSPTIPFDDADTHLLIPAVNRLLEPQNPSAEGTAPDFIDSRGSVFLGGFRAGVSDATPPF
jgi:4-hydroxy-tetrahydrodipicolinate synthase